MRRKLREGYPYHASIPAILVKVDSTRVFSHCRVGELLGRICTEKALLVPFRQQAFPEMYGICTRLLHALYVTSLAWFGR
jgi:hypothetical protein